MSPCKGALSPTGRWLFARTQRAAVEFGRHRIVDGQGGADVMRVRTAVNGETLESQYPTAQLVQRYTLLIGSNHNREAYALVLKYIVNVVVDFSRRVKGAFLPAGHFPARRLEPESAAPKVASTELSPANRPLWNDRERARSALLRLLLSQRAWQSPPSLRAKTGRRSGGQHCRT